MTLEQALAMSINGAVPGRLGRIESARDGDLVLVDTTRAHHLAADHPVPALALQTHTGHPVGPTDPCSLDLRHYR